jgi:hypothetical protein
MDGLTITSPERAKKEKEKKQARDKREWDQSLVRTKLSPASTGTVSILIYNTTYQFLTRVNNITYLRASWGIAGLTLVQRRKEKKKKSRSDYLYEVSNNFLFVIKY